VLHLDRSPLATAPPWSGSPGTVTARPSPGWPAPKPGQPGRLFYRLNIHRRRKGERPSLSEADYAHLITAAHRTLGAPLIVTGSSRCRIPAGPLTA
jgi:hypothetical protein